MPPKKKGSKEAFSSSHELHSFVTRQENVDYTAGSSDLTRTQFFKYISKVSQTTEL